MSDGVISRPHYFERQFLRTQDFVDEQLYHVGMLSRHNIAQHTWGTVRGLEIILDDNQKPVVLPGLGVDGYGRVLVLPERTGLAASEFDRQGNILDVWLLYDRQPSDMVPTGYLPGPPTADNTFYRWQELARVELHAPDPDHPDPRQPAPVPAADLAAYGPADPPVDDPDRRWPLYLGRVTRTQPKPKDPGVFVVDLSGRPYAGLVGGSITSPSVEARVRVQLGAELADDRKRFAIFLTPAPQPGAATPPEEEALARLEVDDDGSIAVRGDTTVYGDLTVDGGAVTFGPAAEVPQAQPWRIYHVAPPQPGAAAQAGTDAGGEPAAAPAGGQAAQGTATTIVAAPAAQTPQAGKAAGQAGKTAGAGSGAQDSADVGQPEQLRIELAAPKSLPAAQPGAQPATQPAVQPAGQPGSQPAAQPRQQVVIGAWSDKDKVFKPYLTVADDGTVTVAGNLVVNGQIQAPVQSPVVLSPEAQAMATSAAFNLIANAPNLLRTGAQAPAAGAPDGRQVLLQQAAALLREQPALLKTLFGLVGQDVLAKQAKADDQLHQTLSSALK